MFKLLTLFVFVTLARSELFKIIQLDKSGLYYEHLGKVNHFDSEWNLITYFDIYGLHKKVDLVESVLFETKNICTHNTFNNFSLCQTSLLILEQLFPQLKNQEDILKELTGRQNSVHHRMKRSYIDGVGSIMKVLFGTLDVEDAKRYDKVINNLDNNEHEIVNLLKSQTQIVKTTITNFNNTITDLEKNEKIFSKNLEILSNYTKDVNQKLFDIDMKQDLDEHLSFLTLITSELNNEISTIINAILFAKNNNLHPIIITPEQYLFELKKTISHIPAQTKYPMDLNDNNVSDLMNLISIVSYYMNDKIIFIIKTPLITQQTYDMYNLVPVPILNKNNTFLFILPNKKYFMISSNKIHYTSLDDINNCKKLVNDKYICQLEQPLYSVHAKPSCETEILLTNTNKVPDICDTRLSLIKDEQWYKLENENQWLYVIPNKVIATLNCKNDEPQDLDLYKTGILQLSRNCKLYTSNILLQSSNKNMESKYISILPDFDIINDDCCKKLKNRTLHDKIEFIPLSRTNLNLEDLNIASHKIDKINILLDNLQEQNVFEKVVNNTYFIFFVMSVIKFIGLYLIYRFGKYLILRKFFCTTRDRLLAIEDSRNCCGRITNCVTLNFNKNNTDNNLTEVELEEVSSSDRNNVERTPLRRSARLAQLKSN